jgi:hypothetical protein
VITFQPAGVGAPVFHCLVDANKADYLQLVVFNKKMNFFEFVLFRYRGATKWIHVAVLPDF